MEIPGYMFDARQFAQLLIARSYPERTDEESAILRDYLERHLLEYDRVEFSVRVGTPATPDPSHLDGVQRNTVYSSLKRIDMLGWQGEHVTIVELKKHITHAALGQILTYRMLLLEERPGLEDPVLVVIGRTVDPDALRALKAAGIHVYIYDAAADGSGADARGLSPHHGDAP